MSVDVGLALAYGQDLAYARMKSRCRIERSTGEVERHEDGTVSETATVVYGPDVLPHEGRCRVRMGTVAGGVLQIGGGSDVIQHTHLHVPVGVILDRGDKVTILESDNPAAVGAEYTVRALAQGDQVTASRWSVEAIT